MKKVSPILQKKLTDESSCFTFIVKSKGLFSMMCWTVLVAKLEMSIDAAMGY